jgi:hypothetical protein
MRIKNLTIKAMLVIAVLITVGALWIVRRVRAFNPQPDPPFGMVGITRGQTMRLSIVDLAQPNSDGTIPPPCRVVLTFRDADGHAFKNSDGQVVRQVVELQMGQSASLDLNADNFIPSSTNAVSTRLQLRPFVRELESPSEIPPDPCRASMEIFDNASGRTSIFAPGS